MRSTAALALAAAAAACSSDGPTTPRSDRLASQLNAIADSSEAFAGPFGFALYSAASIVEAGGRISHVTIELDGVPEPFDAVAFRMSYSEQACQQLFSGFGGFGETGLAGDSSDVVEDSWDYFCAPRQSLVAWQGDPVRRIAVIQGDTGSSAINTEGFAPWAFWASYFDRETRADWWLNSGTQVASLVSDNGPCRQPAPRNGPIREIECRLATLRHAFDLEMYQFHWSDGGEILPMRPRGSIVGDTVVYSDTGIVIWPGDSTYTPPEPHTMRMTSRPISGLTMRVTSIDTTWMNRRTARAMLARPRASSR